MLALLAVRVVLELVLVALALVQAAALLAAAVVVVAVLAALAVVLVALAGVTQLAHMRARKTVVEVADLVAAAIALAGA